MLPRVPVNLGLLLRVPRAVRTRHILQEDRQQHAHDARQQCEPLLLSAKLAARR